MTTLGVASVEALGWALVHFAWQGVLAAAAFAVLDAAAQGASARVRYALAALTLCAMALLPPLTILLRHGSPSESAPAVVALPAVSGRAPAAPARPPAIGAGTVVAVRARVANALPAVVALWCAGVVLLSIRYLGGWRLVQRMDRSARPLVDGAGAERLASLLRRMRVGRTVRLLESAMVEVPTVVGWLRPAILLPAATLAGLSVEQLEAILAHELAHVRRHDYLASLLQSGVETVLFYHPAVWWVSHRMRVERELCCDDEAVQACGNALEYARALAGLEAMRPAPRLAPAATGGPLFERIARLVADPARHGLRASRGAAALLGAAALALALTGVTTLTASTTVAQSEGERTRPGAATSKRTSVPASPATATPAAGTRASAPAAHAEAPSTGRRVPVEKIIELADAGITPEYVEEMDALGYPNLSWDQLIEIRTQGVGPEYVRDLAAEGLKGLSASDLVELRTQGVSADYVRALREAGYSGLSMTELVDLRSHGVTPEFIRELKEAGYDRLTTGELIDLRSHGVEPALLKRLNGRGERSR
jgi:beta-lactamase regulating signal transducer with metallopeptidase domain